MQDPSKPMSLIFLANRGFYEDMVNDTWFNATLPKIEIADLGTQQVQQTLYLSGNPGSVLACTEQMQIWFVPSSFLILNNRLIPPVTPPPIPRCVPTSTPGTFGVAITIIILERKCRLSPI